VTDTEENAGHRLDFQVQHRVTLAFGKVSYVALHLTDVVDHLSVHAGDDPCHVVLAKAE
jgi:hypothetical protein